jgi:signal peptidase
MVACVGLVVLVLAVVGLPRLLGWQGVIVLSGSMEPALDVGGLAFVDTSTSIDSLEPGDIITYSSAKEPGILRSHRIVEVQGEGDATTFRTKGDANEDVDDRVVQAGEVVGKVRWHVPYGGYVANVLRDRQKFLLLVGIPGALVVLGECRRIQRALREGRRQVEAAVQSVQAAPGAQPLPATGPSSSHDV